MPHLSPHNGRLFHPTKTHEIFFLRFLALALFIQGCFSIPTHASELARIHPDLESKASKIHTLVLLPPKIAMYEIGAGGVPEKMAEWEASANDNVSQALENQSAKFDALHFMRLDDTSLQKEARDIYDETRLLYETVSQMILFHTYNPHAPWFLPGKVSDFVYSLGPEVHTLSPQADAFLIIEGFDQRSSGGRKTLLTGATIIGAALGVVAIPRGGANMVTASLVDAKTGAVLWFYRTLRPYDLRDASSAAAFAVDLFKDLPTLGTLHE